MRYYLAIDIGASSGRHLLGWIEDGVMKTEEIYRFKNSPKKTVDECGKPTLVWDVDYLCGEILEGLKAARKCGKIPFSIGIDTWGVDYALLDSDGNRLGEVFCYRDSRTESKIPKVHGTVPFEQLYDKTGIQFESFNTVYQLACDRDSGKMDKAEHLLMLPDYFSYRLTGIMRQEYTNATTTGMVNAVTHKWDSEILEALGYKKTLFGELSQPGSLVGELSDEVAKEVGYKARVTLPATHDTASAVLAAPLDGASPYISSGTWSLLGIEQCHAHTSEAARLANYSNEGSVHGSFRLQKNIMGLWMIQQIRHEANDRYDFAELADMARESVTESDIDVNDSRFLAPASMTDEVCAAVGRRLSIGEMAYAVYDNLAKSYAEAMEALEKITGERYSTLNIIGGGSKNELLNELTAKYTGRKVITGPTEGTAIGNILMQMVGSGELDSIADGRKIIKKSFDIREVKGI